jgi:hypothetical protein
VVKAHTVSGNDLLVTAAMKRAALMEIRADDFGWQVFPMLLRVKIVFRLAGRS